MAEMCLILGQIKSFMKNRILIFYNIFFHISKTNEQIVMLSSDIDRGRAMNILDQ